MTLLDLLGFHFIGYPPLSLFLCIQDLILDQIYQNEINTAILK